MEETPNKPTRGGRRSGAGRKAKENKAQTCTFRLSPEALAIVQAEPPRKRSRFVDAAIKAFYEKNKPYIEFEETQF